MLPTVVWVRLRLPKLTLLMEGVTILPIVIPPVVMAAGLEELQGTRPVDGQAAVQPPLTALTPFYVILALPFTYRAIDTGVRAIDLHTLVDASRNLGASLASTLSAGDPAERPDRRARRDVPDDRAVPRRGRDRDPCSTTPSP
jgi:putative spermidine/putrescine transport system permease protein